MLIWKLATNNTYLSLLNHDDIRPIIACNNDSEDSRVLAPYSNNLESKYSEYIFDERTLTDKSTIKAICSMEKTTYVVVNRLEAKSIKYIQSQLVGVKVVMLYVDHAECDIAFFRKINWLSSISMPLCLCSNNYERILLFSLLDPHAVICDLPDRQINNLKSEFLQAVNKPKSIMEVDIMSTHYVSIVSRNDIEAGEYLDQSMLALRSVKEKGLPIHMLECLDGIKLRYPLKKGEALTFGHLYIGLNCHAGN